MSTVKPTNRAWPSSVVEKPRMRGTLSAVNRMRSSQIFRPRKTQASRRAVPPILRMVLRDDGDAEPDRDDEGDEDDEAAADGVCLGHGRRK